MTRRDRTLHRDTTDRKLGGVCSGLAHYFDVDTLLVRVAFVAALVFGGGSLVAYLLFWWLLDEAPLGPVDDALETDLSPAAPGEQRDAA